MLLGGPFWRLLVTLLVIVALQAQIISASLGVSPLCEADPSSLTHGVRQTIAFFRIRPSNFPGFEAANFIVSSGPSLQPTQPTVEAVVTSGGFGCRLEGNSTNVETIWSNSSADGTDIIIEVYLGPGDGDGFVPEVTVIPKDDSLSPIKTTPYPGGWRLAQAPALFVIIEEPTGAFLHVDDGFIVATTTGLFSFPTSPLNEQNFTAPATLLRKCNDTVVALSEGEVRFFNFLSSENKTVSILELCRDYGNVTDIVITDCPRDDISGTHARVIFESGHQYLTTGKNESNSMGKHFRSMLGPVVNWFVPSHGNAMLCKKDKCINGTFPSTPLAVSHVISGSNQSGPLSSCIPNGALDFQWVLFEDGRIGFVSINETSVVLEATSQEAGIVSFDARTMSGISNPRDVVAVTSSGDICSVALACDGLNYDSVLVTNCVRIAKSGTILSVHFQEHTNKIAVLTQSGVFVAELVQSLHNMSLRFVPNEDNLMDPYRNGIMHVNTAAALEPWTCERQAELVLDFVISPDSGVISSLPLKDGTPAGLLESECDFKVSGDKRWQQLRCLLQKESSSNLKLPVSFFPSPPPTRVISTVSLFCNGALSAVSPGILMNGNKGVVGLVKYVDQQVPNSVGLVAERFNLVFFPAPTAEENTFLPYGMRLSSQHCFFSLSKGSDPRKTLDVIVPNVAANGISSVWIFCENESEDLSYPIDINFLEKNPYPVTSDFYDVKRPFVRTSPLVIIWDLFNSTSEAITLEAGTTVHYKIDGLDSNTFNVTGDKSCLIDSEFLSQEPRQVNRSGRLNCTHIGRLSDIVFTHGNASVKTTVNSWTLVRISNHNYSTTVSTFTLESAFPYNAAVSNKTVSVTTDSNEAGKKACEASVGPLSSNEKQFDVTVRCAKMVSVLDDIRFTVQSSDGNVGFLAFTLPPIETRGHAVLVWQGYKALNSMRVFAHLDRSVMHLELSHTTSRGSYFKVQTDDTSNCVLDHGLTQSDSIALFIAPNSDRTAPFYFVCKKRGAEVCKVSIAWMGGDLYSASSSMDIKCVSKSEYAGIQWVTRESFDLNVFHGELNSEIDPPTVALFRPPHDKYPIFLITSRDADKMMALDSPGSCKLKPHDRNLYRLECDFNMKPKQNLKIGLRNSSHILFFTLCVQLEAHIEATGGNFPTQVHVGTPTKLDVRFVRDATAYVHIEYLDDVGGACFLYIFNNERNEAKTIIPVKTGKQFWLECVRVSKFRLSTFVSEQSITWKSPVMHAVESSFLLVKHENHDNFQVAIHCGAARSDNYENVNAVLSILSTPPPACSKQCTFADDLLSIDVPNACSMKNYSLACPISKECEFSVRLTFSNPSNFLGAISPVFPGPIPIRLQLEADDTGDYFHYVDTFKPYNLSVSLEKMCCSDEVGELSVSLSSAVGNCTISDQTPREESVTFSLLCTDPTAWGPSIIVSRENASYVVFQPSVPLHVRGQLSIIECLEEKCSVPEGSTDELSPRPELKMYALEESRFVLHVFPAAVQDIRFDVRVETCTIHTGGDPPSDSHQMAVVTVQKGQWFSNETLSIKCDQPHTEKVFVSMESVPGFQSLEYTENSFELNVLGQTRIKDFDFKYIIPNNETLLKIEGRFTAAPTPDPATVFTATASNTCCKASKPELSPNEDDPNEWRFFVECCVTNPDPVTVHIASESYEPSQSNEFVVSASGSLHWFQGENEVHPEKGILNLLTHIIYTLKIHLSNATRPRPTDVTVMVDEMTFGDESPIMFAKSIDGEWKNETVVNAHENETEVIVFFRSEVPYESSIMSFSQVLALFTNSTHLETLIGPQINFSASICPQYAASEKTFSTSVQGPFGSNESYLSHLWVTCNEGMYLEESISTRVFCDGTGWQGGPFSCTPATCTPYEPQNDKGKIVDSSEVTSFLLHDNITIKCDRGYVINQDPATSPGEVQKSEMAVCSAGDNDPNGKQGSWKRVPKNEDYRGAPLSCSAIDCWMITKSTSDSSGGLMYVPNSQMTLNSTTLHSIVSFSCHDGFISRFKNSSQAKCESSGYWEWIDPLSQPACEPLGCFDFEDSQGKGGPDLILNVRNVTYSMSKNNSDSSYGEGTIATFICEEGFRHQSNGMSQDFVTCGPKGWSRLNNTCYEISCSPEGKKFKYQRDGADLPGNMDTLPFRTEAFLDCDLGRNPQEVGGEKRSPPPPRVCNDTGEAIGEWKGPKSECVLHVCPMITCPSDMPPECNATITYVDSKHQPFSSNQQHFERTFGSYAIASCEDPDFEVKPSTLVVQECRERGKEWSGMSGRNKNPICAAKMCQNISGNALIVNYVNETHGSLRINTTAILSCEEGKVIEGDSKLVCQRGGWYSHQSNQTYNSTNYPRCEYPKCDKLSPVNGIITYTDGGNGYLSVNATATLECESGFSLPSTGNAFVCDGVTKKWVSYQALESVDENPDLITCNDINECDESDTCPERYSNGVMLPSKCFNTKGSYACSPIVTEITVRGVNYQNGIPSSTSNKTEIFMPSTSPHQLHLSVIPGLYNKTVELSLKEIKFGHYTCDIKLDISGKKSVACLAPAAIGEKHVLQFQYCLGTTPDPCPWHETDFFISYHGPVLTPSSLRSHSRDQSFGTHHLVSATSFGESIQMTGSNFPAENDVSSIQIVFGTLESLSGPRPLETNRKCSITDLKPDQFVCDMNVTEASSETSLHFLVDVLGRQVISKDVYSFVSPVSISSIEPVEGCDVEDGNVVRCNTDGSATVKIRGNGFLPPLRVLVDGGTCIIAKESENEIVCKLPIRSGQNLAVTVFSGSLNAEYQSISFSTPAISAIDSSICEPEVKSEDSGQGSTRLKKCDRSGNAMLTVHGDFFGKEGAHVYVGSDACTSVVHQKGNEQKLLTCIIPGGSQIDLPVVVFQSGGFSDGSILLSYVQCPIGERNDGILCKKCDPGTFTNSEGQDECRACAPGTFMSVSGSSECIPCPPGRYSGHGASECTACPLGTFSAGHASECTICSVGSYSSSPAATACLPCPHGATSDSDFAGCRCLPGFFMNYLRQCEECMPGGDCSDIGSTYFSILPLPGFYPTTLATDSSAPRVLRFKMTIRTDLPLDTMGGRNNLLLFLMRSIYESNNIDRNRVVIRSVEAISISDVAVFDPSKLAQLLSRGDGTIASQQQFQTTLAEASTLGSSGVPGAVVVIDINPGMRKESVPNKDIMLEILRLLTNETSLMFGMFRSNTTSLMIDSEYHRSAFTFFEECLSDACVGGPVLCAKGYTGPLCSVCTAKYTKTSTYECQYCGTRESLYRSIAVSLGILLLVCALFVIAVAGDTLNSIDYPRVLRPIPFSAIIRMVACAVQTWAIAAQFDMQWSGILSDLMIFLSAYGNIGLNAITLDCFSSNLEGHGSAETVRPLFLTAIAALALPVFAMVFPLLLLFPAYYIHRSYYLRHLRHLGDQLEQYNIIDRNTETMSSRKVQTGITSTAALSARRAIAGNFSPQPQFYSSPLASPHPPPFPVDVNVQTEKDTSAVNSRQKAISLKDIAAESQERIPLSKGAIQSKNHGRTQQANGDKPATPHTLTSTGSMSVLVPQESNAPSVGSLNLQMCDISKRQKRIKDAYMFLYVGFVVVALYLLHPSICRAFFRLVACKVVGFSSLNALDRFVRDDNGSLVEYKAKDFALPRASKLLVLADMGLECFSGEHFVWVFTLGLLILLLWVIGIPLTFYYFVRNNVQILRCAPRVPTEDDRNRRARFLYGFSFLFVGYQPRWYLWFLVEMAAKVAYVALSIFIPGQMHTQLLLASFVSFVTVAVQGLALPFDCTILEFFGFVSLLVVFGLFFQANFFFIDLEISDEQKEKLTSLIFASFFLFLGVTICVIALVIYKNIKAKKTWDDFQEAVKRGDDPTSILRRWHKANKGKVEFGRKIGMTAFEIASEIENYLNIVSVMNTSVSLSSSVAVASFSISETKHIQEINDIDVLTSESETSDAADEDKDSESSSSTSSCDSSCSCHDSETKDGCNETPPAPALFPGAKKNLHVSIDSSCSTDDDDIDDPPSWTRRAPSPTGRNRSKRVPQPLAAKSSLSE